jgi:hypothetical protein
MIDGSLLNSWHMLLEVIESGDPCAAMRSLVPGLAANQAQELCLLMTSLADTAEEGATREARRTAARAISGDFPRYAPPSKRQMVAVPPATPTPGPSLEAAQVRLATGIRRPRASGSAPDNRSEKQEDLLKDRNVQFLLAFARQVAGSCPRVRDALETARPELCLLALYGKRRRRTLRGLAQNLQRAARWLEGGLAALPAASEVQLADLLGDMGDQPCGRHAPAAMVKTFDLVWGMLGIPTIVSPLSRGIAGRLCEAISRDALAPVRKALHLPLVAILALEMEISEGPRSSLSDREYALGGAELTKVYVSARWGDMEFLDFSAMALHNEFWGGEACFMQTKTSGPGRATEVLPCWVSRLHTLSSKDWVGPYLARLESSGLSPPKGCFLMDPVSGGPMSYDVKLRLTRALWAKLKIKGAAVALGAKGAVALDDGATLPPAFCALLGEHCARGALPFLGFQLGLDKDTYLRYFGRWVPGDSVDDYTRESRRGVLLGVKLVMEAIHRGWRPDESMSGQRAVDRGGPSADIKHLLFWDVLGSPQPTSASSAAPPLVAAPPSQASWANGAAKPLPDGELSDSAGPVSIDFPPQGANQVAVTRLPRQGGKLDRAHTLREPSEAMDAKQPRLTTCGYTLGVDILYFKVFTFVWPHIGNVKFARKCGRRGCAAELELLVPEDGASDSSSGSSSVSLDGQL